MPPTSFAGLPDFSDAIKLRTSLSQVDSRVFGVDEHLKPNSTNPLGGNVPIVDQRGRAFSRSLLKHNQKVLVIDSKTPTGSVIQYRQGKHQAFGIVRQTRQINADTAVEVKPISSFQAQLYMRQHPKIDTINLSSDNELDANVISRVFAASNWTIDFFIDPAERLVLWLYVTLFGKLPSLEVDPVKTARLYLALVSLAILSFVALIIIARS